MTTFSQLVEKIAQEALRPDMLVEIATYLNQTLRELHFEPTRGNVIHYRDNLHEQLLYVNQQEGFRWDVPNPATFQNVAACRYDSAFGSSGPVWAKEINRPGPTMTSEKYWFYRSNESIFFYGYGATGSQIALSWYEYTKSLKFHQDALTRPAQFDLESGWSYHEDYDTNDERRKLARELTSNWILMRWEALLEEGLRAKVYKRLSDTERARTSYSMYTTLRQGIFSAESGALAGTS